MFRAEDANPLVKEGKENAMAETTSARTELVSPQNLKGFQDLLPDEMIARHWVIEKIKTVYERYGFVPLETPVLEYLTTLAGTGGEEATKQTFKLESPERVTIGMRFDLTVPFARTLAQYPEKLKLPFRRYQIGPVFRADEPKENRLRQFTQFDIDAAGSESVAVDAEIVAAMCDAMREVGFRNETGGGKSVQEFQVRINNRKLLNALLDSCNITRSETQKHVLRIVDKLLKAGVDNVRKELGEGRVDESGDPIKGAGLSADAIEKVLTFISIRGTSRGDTIDRIARFLPETPIAKAAVQETREFAAALDTLRVQECDTIFDPSLARGLAYYTGPIFEAFVPPELDSIMGGGRYDNLVERFLTKGVPATGASIGLERFIAALNRLGKLQASATTVKVLVAALRGTPVDALLAVATELRSRKIATEVFFGEPGTSLRDQLSLANSRGVPIAIILGEDELKNNTVSVKDLRIGMQKRAEIQDREEYRKAGKVGQMTVERSKLVETVTDLLKQRSE
jgi:histidyl-tRNA synthetase